MFILKRKKKKEKYSLPLFLSVSLNSATFGISQCLEYFTRLKKEGFLRDEKNKNNLTSLIDTMNVKLISLHKI